MISPKMMSYYENIDNLNKVDEIVNLKLTAAIEEAGIHTMQITHRVKSVDSIEGKLARKPEKYASAMSLTDLIGFRIICYFTEQIDMISAIIEKLFEVDRDNCIDKSKTLSPNAFGYLSVHYICMLKPSDDYPEELCKYKFEFQIRTVLQHTWAEIEHDLGYKNEFGVPLHVRREFSRMASLLEVADQGFGRIKSQLEAYSAIVIDKLQRGDVQDVAIDTLSLREFMKYNSEYLSLINDISNLTGGKITQANADPFIKQLEFLGITELGGLDSAIKEHYDLTLDIARSSLQGMEIDEYSCFVGLYYLTRAMLVTGSYSEKDIMDFFALSSSKKASIMHNTNRIINLRKKYL